MSAQKRIRKRSGIDSLTVSVLAHVDNLSTSYSQHIHSFIQVYPQNQKTATHPPRTTSGGRTPAASRAVTPAHKERGVRGRARGASVPSRLSRLRPAAYTRAHLPTHSALPAPLRVKRGEHGESVASNVGGSPQAATGAAVTHRAALCVSSPHGRARRSGRRLCATAAPGWTAETVPAFE